MCKHCGCQGHQTDHGHGSGRHHAHGGHDQHNHSDSGRPHHGTEHKHDGCDCDADADTIDSEDVDELTAAIKTLTERIAALEDQQR